MICIQTCWGRLSLRDVPTHPSLRGASTHPSLRGASTQPASRGASTPPSLRGAQRRGNPRVGHCAGSAGDCFATLAMTRYELAKTCLGLTVTCLALANTSPSLRGASTHLVIARSAATWQSIVGRCVGSAGDCFAALAMT